jgi:hypothetical protein
MEDKIDGHVARKGDKHNKNNNDNKTLAWTS